MIKFYFSDYEKFKQITKIFSNVIFWTDHDGFKIISLVKGFNALICYIGAKPDTFKSDFAIAFEMEKVDYGTI